MHMHSQCFPQGLGPLMTYNYLSVLTQDNMDSHYLQSRGNSINLGWHSHSHRQWEPIGVHSETLYWKACMKTHNYNNELVMVTLDPATWYTYYIRYDFTYYETYNCPPL